MKMNRREVRKLMAQIEAQGAKFVLIEIRPGGAPSFVLDAPAGHPWFQSFPLKDQLIENYALILDLLSPKKPSSRPKRRHCEICASGKGCRRRSAGFGGEPSCPTCGHECRMHFAPVFGRDPETGERAQIFAPGCRGRADENAAIFTCPCSGWPTPAPVKTLAERFCEMVASKPPGFYTIDDMIFATERTPVWIRRTLKAAGLSHLAAKASRAKRGAAQVADGQLPLDAGSGKEENI